MMSLMSEKVGHTAKYVPACPISRILQEYQTSEKSKRSYHGFSYAHLKTDNWLQNFESISEKTVTNEKP